MTNDECQMGAAVRGDDRWENSYAAAGERRADWLSATQQAGSLRYAIFKK